MNRLISLIALGTSLGILGNTGLHGAQPKPLDPQEETKTKAAADEQDEIEIPAVPAVPRAKPGKATVGIATAPMAVPFAPNRLETFGGRGPAPAGKPLVIRSSNPDPKEEANLEEDLAVMTHLFDKSFEDLPGGRPHAFKAAGIDVFFTPGQTPMRCFYLDGYGAVFLLNVSFPLVPPPQKVDREKPAVDSAWAEAQEELFGQPSEGRFGGPAEEYSEEKVTKLKESLFDTLKNATNIRGLKSDDSIVVVVFGSSTTPRGKGRIAAKRAVVAHEGDTFLWQDGEAPRRQTILTLRVKKTDIDAYAKGKLNTEDFQKRASPTAYNSGAANGLFGSEVGFGGLGGVRR
jgi:hypothetical protein